MLMAIITLRFLRVCRSGVLENRKCPAENNTTSTRRHMAKVSRTCVEHTTIPPRPDGYSCWGCLFLGMMLPRIIALPDEDYSWAIGLLRQPMPSAACMRATGSHRVTATHAAPPPYDGARCIAASLFPRWSPRRDARMPQLNML